MAINKTIYFKPNATHWVRVANDYNLFTWSSMDENMTYAVVNGSIWKWNVTQSKYVSYFNNTVSLFNET